MTEVDTRKLERQITLQERLIEELTLFFKDTSYFKHYDVYEPEQEHVIVRVFVFKPRIKGLVPFTKMIGDNVIEAENTGITAINLVKVVKTEREGFAPGEVYWVPSDEVVGMDWNPKFIAAFGQGMTQGRHGKMSPVHEGIEKMLPNIQIKWDRYKLFRPWVFSSMGETPADLDKEIYGIPASKMRYKVNPERALKEAKAELKNLKNELAKYKN